MTSPASVKVGRGDPALPSRRVLIVGEAPGGRISGGLTRSRLSDLSGLPWEEWADWKNLLDDWPGRGTGKGSAWDVRAARAAARDFDVSGYDDVLLLGRRVAGTILPGGSGFPLFRWTDWRSTRAAAGDDGVVHLYDRRSAGFPLCGNARAPVEGTFDPKRPDLGVRCGHCAEADARARRVEPRVAVIPHTSGIVRWWNDPENVETARRFLADLAHAAA